MLSEFDRQPQKRKQAVQKKDQLVRHQKNSYSNSTHSKMNNRLGHAWGWSASKQHELFSPPAVAGGHDDVCWYSLQQKEEPRHLKDNEHVVGFSSSCLLRCFVPVLLYSAVFHQANEEDPQKRYSTTRSVVAGGGCGYCQTSGPRPNCNPPQQQ